MPVPQKISSAANSQITISNTSINLRETFITNSESSGVLDADTYTINVQDANIRLFWDGNTPTATLGFPLSVGGTLTLKGVQSKDINLIRSGASDAKINIQVGAAVANFNL